MKGGRAAAAALLLLGFSPWLEGAGFLGQGAAQALPAFSLGAVLLLAAMGAIKDGPGSGLAAAALALNLGILAPWIPLPSEVAPSSEPPFRILLSNVLCSNRDCGRLLDLIQNEKPDLIVLQELTPAWRRGLSSLEKEYPFGSWDDRPGVRGQAVLSRGKIAIRFQEGGLGLCNPLGSGKAWSPDGRGFFLAIYHPYPPVLPRRERERNRDLERLGTLLSHIKGPKILVGDMNAAMWIPTFRQMARAAGLSDARMGKGILPSWGIPGGRPWLPLDHILASPEFQVLACRIGPDIGSDHRPVLVDLALTK